MCVCCSSYVLFVPWRVEWVGGWCWGSVLTLGQTASPSCPFSCVFCYGIIYFWTKCSMFCEISRILPRVLHLFLQAFQKPSLSLHSTACYPQNIFDSLENCKNSRLIYISWVNLREPPNYVREVEKREKCPCRLYSKTSILPTQRQAPLNPYFCLWCFSLTHNTEGVPFPSPV